jgi:hypothetical protein
MTDANNVILFPEERIHDKAHTAAGIDMVEQTVENIIKATAIQKNAQRNRVIEAIIPFVYGQLNIMGVNAKGTDERIGIASSFVIEAFRAMLGYHFDIKHPLHDVIPKIMSYDDRGLYKIDEAKLKECFKYE